MEGCDTGVSFRSVHDPTRDLTHTVISNTTNGAWDVTRLLARHLRHAPLLTRAGPRATVASQDGPSIVWMAWSTHEPSSSAAGWPG